jgi:hypothetical protein
MSASRVGAHQEEDSHDMDIPAPVHFRCSRNDLSNCLAAGTARVVRDQISRGSQSWLALLGLVWPCSLGGVALSGMNSFPHLFCFTRACIAPVLIALIRHNVLTIICERQLVVL